MKESILLHDVGRLVVGTLVLYSVQFFLPVSYCVVSGWKKFNKNLL